MQQAVDKNGPAGTLAKQMPGRRQLPQGSLPQHHIQRLLILAKAVNAGTRATRQTMPRQIKSKHRQTPAQRPFDQVPVQAHMVEIAMQDDQRAARLRRPPDLHGQRAMPGIYLSQMLAGTLTEVDAVVAGIALRLLIQRALQVQCWQLLRQPFYQGVIHGKSIQGKRDTTDVSRHRFPCDGHDLQPIIV